MPLHSQLPHATSKILILPHNFEPSHVSLDCDLLVIDYATCYVRNDKEEDLCRSYANMKIQVPWILLTSNFEYYKTDNENIVYYPVHLIQCIIENKDSHVDIRRKRNFDVGFVNGNLHNIRIMLALELFKYEWFSKCRINFPDVTRLDKTQKNVYLNTVSHMNDSEKKLLSEFVKQLPLDADPTEGLDNVGLKAAYNLNGNAGFVDCYVNAMVESEWNLPYITEKSIKPFLAGQFSAVLANVGVYSHLEDLGFDIMDSYINLKTQGDMHSSISDMCKQIDMLLQNIEPAWEDSYTRRLANYQLAKSDELLNKLQKKLFDIIAKK